MYMKKSNKRQRVKFLVCSIILFCAFIQQKQEVKAAPSYAMEYDGLPANVKADCVAFARYMVPSLPGGLYSLEDKKKIINSYTPKVGAIAITKGNSSYGHVAYVEAVNGSQITTLNGGWEKKIHIGRYTATASAQGIIGYWYPSNPVSPPVPSTNVSFGDFNINAITDTNGEFYIKVLTPNKNNITAVGCYLYDNDGKLLKSYSESCNYSLAYCNYNCNIKNDMKYTLTPGTSYRITLYAIVDGKEYKDIQRQFTTTGSSDKEAPVISDITIQSIDYNGYTIRCKVTDNKGINRVQFPTWTERNGQDDIVSNWSTNTAVKGTLNVDGYYYFNVGRLSHNNESGPYYTHIYAYDNDGNYSCYNGSLTTNITLPTIQVVDKWGLCECWSKNVVSVNFCVYAENQSLEFQEVKVITTAELDGTTVSVEKNFGSKKIASSDGESFLQVIDNRDLKGATENFKTTIYLTDMSGKTTMAFICYNPKFYTDTTYATMKIGERGTAPFDLSTTRLAYWKTHCGDIITPVTTDEGYTTDTFIAEKEGRAYVVGIELKSGKTFVHVVDVIDPNSLKPEISNKNGNTINGNNPKHINSNRNIKNTKKYNVYNQIKETHKSIKFSKVTNVKLKNKRGKKISVSWKKIPCASSYLIQYAQNKKFTKKKKIVRISKNKASKTIIGLKLKKKYFVRVRYIKSYKGKKYYGKWSSVKKIKIKK